MNARDKQITLLRAVPLQEKMFSLGPIKCNEIASHSVTTKGLDHFSQ